MSIHEAFTFRLSSWAVILQNSATVTGVTLEKRVKSSIQTTADFPGWNEFTWQLPAVLGNTKHPGELGRSKNCSCCGAEAGEGAAGKERSRNGNRAATCCWHVEQLEGGWRSISFRVFVGFAWLLCACKYAYGHCVVYDAFGAAHVTKECEAQNRERQKGSCVRNGSPMSHDPVCSSQVYWNGSMSNALLTYFPDSSTGCVGRHRVGKVLVALPSTRVLLVPSEPRAASPCLPSCGRRNLFLKLWPTARRF